MMTSIVKVANIVINFSGSNHSVKALDSKPADNIICNAVTIVITFSTVWTEFSGKFKYYFN